MVLYRGTLDENLSFKKTVSFLLSKLHSSCRNIYSPVIWTFALLLALLLSPLMWHGHDVYRRHIMKLASSFGACLSWCHFWAPLFACYPPLGVVGLSLNTRYEDSLQTYNDIRGARRDQRNSVLGCRNGGGIHGIDVW
jgi:hypothetical protein